MCMIGKTNLKSITKKCGQNSQLLAQNGHLNSIIFNPILHYFFNCFLDESDGDKIQAISPFVDILVKTIKCMIYCLLFQTKLFK